MSIDPRTSKSSAKDGVGTLRMNPGDDLRYLRARQLEELKAADAAKCATARVCHEQLAARYEARAMQLAMSLHLQQFGR
jgi:hypothetical protein